MTGYDALSVVTKLLHLQGEIPQDLLGILDRSLDGIVTFYDA